MSDKTNTEKLTTTLASCLTNQIPLDKASLSLDYWSDKPSLTFNAEKLSRAELQNLKRCCEFKVEGDAASGFKALIGTTNDQALTVKVEKALTCRKVTVEGLTVTEMDKVVENFKQGKAFIMDCEQTSGVEIEAVEETEVPW